MRKKHTKDVSMKKTIDEIRAELFCGKRIYDIGIEVCGDKDLVVLAPHPPRGLDPDRVTFLRRQLVRLERLEAVVGDHLAALTVFALDRRHLPIGERRQAVDPGDVFLFVGLVVVLRIAERVVEIVVEYFRSVVLSGLSA